MKPKLPKRYPFARALSALDASIKHWKRIVAGGPCDPHPLCTWRESTNPIMVIKHARRELAFRRRLQRWLVSEMEKRELKPRKTGCDSHFNKLKQKTMKRR